MQRLKPFPGFGDDHVVSFRQGRQVPDQGRAQVRHVAGDGEYVRNAAVMEAGVDPPRAMYPSARRESSFIIAKMSAREKTGRSPVGFLSYGEGRERLKVTPAPQPEVSVGLSRSGTFPRVYMRATPKSGQTLKARKSSGLFTSPRPRRDPPPGKGDRGGRRSAWRARCR